MFGCFDGRKRKKRKKRKKTKKTKKRKTKTKKKKKKKKKKKRRLRSCVEVQEGKEKTRGKNEKKPEKKFKKKEKGGLTWKTYRRPSWISSMILTNGGWRCPRRGSVCAASTRGCALAGPGPMSRRDGTWKKKKFRVLSFFSPVSVSLKSCRCVESFKPPLSGAVPFASASFFAQKMLSRS